MITKAIVYQWFKDGNTIQNETNQSYTINSATSDDLGNYWVMITNPAIPDLTLTRDTITLVDESIGDSITLIALYNATNGAGWKNKWNLDDNVSTWYGVTITNGRVTEIDLNNNSSNRTLYLRKLETSLN